MTKKIIPLGNRLLVRRKKVGGTLGSGLIIAADTTADRPTDLAEVVYIPEHSFADQMLINQAENIVNSQTQKAVDGSADALTALMTFNHFLKMKSLKPGDEVMISKYVGTDFHDNENPKDMLTLVALEDIVGIVRKQ